MEQTKEFEKTMDDFGKELEKIGNSIYEVQDKIENMCIGDALSASEKQLLTDEKLSKKERKKKVIELFRQRFPKLVKTLDEFDDLIEGFSYIIEQKADKLQDINDRIEEAKEQIEDAKRDLDDL